MATVAATFISSAESPIPFGSGRVEQWRIASGASTGDTSAIAPTYGGVVRGVLGPVSHNLTTTPATTVTVTLIGGTSTMAALDVWVYTWPQR